MTRDPHEETTTMVAEAGREIAASDGDRAYLVVFDREASWRFLLPRDGEVGIGRGEKAELRLDDSSVSRQHARVDVRGGAAALVDLGSHNGVAVNGERIAGVRQLRSRDVITLGQVTLLYHAPREVVVARSPAAFAPRELAIGARTVMITDEATAEVYVLLERLAATDLPILIAGETGTGKELAAAAVHGWSRRSPHRLVALNCATVPEGLAESELFGHERGAFSGAVAAKLGLLESASGGTVFLDEIAELPLAVQAKLLRVLESRRMLRLGDVREREIDLRVVAASNRDLETEVRAGRFREDLFYRLSGATVWLPPLRDRRDAVPLLAQLFLDEAARRDPDAPRALSPAALAALAAHRWPGNVRELRNTIDYLAATVRAPRVELHHLPARLSRAAPAPPPIAVAGYRKLDDELRAVERQRMERALADSGGNQTRAAQLLGMPRRTFVYKMRQYGLGRTNQ